jgi:hypothetical protein
VNNNPYVVMTGVAILFGLCMDYVGNVNLGRRESDAMTGMAAYERTAGSPAVEGPIPPIPYENDVIRTLRTRSQVILTESIRLGVYEPPKY